MTKKILAVLAVLLILVTSVFAQSMYEDMQKRGLPFEGQVINGFEVTRISAFDMIGADVIEFTHIKTGAKVLFFKNEDTNRTFEIAFRTPTETDTGIPHVFEHSTLDGSAKYPSKALWFNLSFQTYNTYMNASTYPFMTIYPVASLSEDQLFTLSDYYTDSVFNPMVMQDKSIFDEEAWRYVLNTPEDDLTIAGTVYSEMLGATTRTRKAGKNFQNEIFPGSYIANDSGGNPDAIPDMTWEEIKEYHDKYYHPSNTLTLMYGKFDNWKGYLGMLDSYFSAYEKKEFDLTDKGYTPITGPVTAEYEFGVEAGSNTENAATIYYGFVCKDVDEDTLNKIDLMTTLAGDSSSVLMENLKNALPYGSFGCYIDFGGPEVLIEFKADNVNAEDAQTFKDIVDASMAQIAEEGFDLNAVDSIVASFSIDLLLSGESSSVGTDLIPNVAYYWAGNDQLYGYMDFIDSVSNFRKWAEEGVFEDLVKKYVTGNSLTALVTTKSVAGLKEQKDAALAERLAQVKASMSQDEINAIVKATVEPEEETVDTAAMVRQIQVVDVDSLPEEARIYEIEDETGADGIRRIWAKADISDLGYAGILLDASGLEQNQIHFFKLWTSMIGELDTKEHTRTELSSLLTRYLYDRTIRISLIEDEITKEMTPRLRVGFIAMNDDMDEAFDLVHELLFENVFDAGRIRDIVSNLKNSLKQTINNNSYNVMVYRALAGTSQLNAYYNYANYLDYYNFLEAVLEALDSNPEAVIAGLQSVVDYFDNSENGIILFAGNEESYRQYLKTADAFMAGLSKHPIEPVTYEFEPVADSEAMIVDSNVNYNIIFADNETLGYEEATGDFDAVSSLINDMYLMPQLRDQRGAYGAYIYLTDDGIYAFTYRDPNIAESYEVYDGLADFVANLAIDQETLDGYILSSYSGYALSTGELTGATSAVLNAIGHEDQERVLSYMKQLKSIKADTFAETYTPLFRTLVENYKHYTAGSASAISQVDGVFEQVLNPFGVQDKSQLVLSDLTAENPYYEMLQFCFVNGLMSAVSDTEFGASQPATLGEFAQVLVTILGASYGPADSIALLAQYAVVPAADVSTVLTAKDIDTITCKVLATFAGYSTDAIVIPQLAEMGITVDAAAPATRELIAFAAYLLAAE